MGLKDFFITAPTPIAEATVDASLAPVNAIDAIGAPYFAYGQSATRSEAMGVPTIARARGIICSTVASLPLETKVKETDETVYSPRVINQPDSRVPGSAIYSYIAEDLLFLGVAYGQVISMYADGRIQEWTRVSPDRVLPQLNANSTEIIGYQVDNKNVPPFGVGSLVVFNGLDEGFLNRAGRTIRAAIALENAAEQFAKEPVPMMVLKSNGTALPADRISKLLQSWGEARRNRGTAFLNADVTMETVGFDPERLQLNQARSYVATELARASGIPAFYVDAESGSSMTYSNANLARQSLVDFSLRPIMTAIEERLSMTGMANDFVPASQEVKFDLDDYLRGSVKERVEVYKMLFDMGAITIDEIRMEEDILG
jgi:HK97 family phage portal protein